MSSADGDRLHDSLAYYFFNMRALDILPEYMLSVGVVDVNTLPIKISYQPDV